VNNLAGDQPGEVGHVDEERRADVVGDVAHGGEVDPPGVGGVAGDQHERAHLPGLGSQGGVVEQAGLRVCAIGPLVEHLARDVGPEAVGQVAAGVERHAEGPLVAEGASQGRPGLVIEVVDVAGAGAGERRRLDAVGEDRPERHQVGVDARVRLDVGVGCPEERLGVVGSERFDGVDVLAPGVEAVPDRALGVLVAEPATHGQQHGR
jgi:hypothetical protein